MDKAEFDKFAEEYLSLHSANIAISGEEPDYFAEYKAVDFSRQLMKLGFKDDLKILDFGSGIGNSVLFLKKWIPRSELTCLDISEKSLEIASNRFTGMAEFRVFDGIIIPYPDETFDAIFVACVFHHIPESLQLNILKELYRVLVTGGVITIFEHNPLNPLTVKVVNSCPFDKNAVLIKPSHMKSKLNVTGFKKLNVNYRIFFPAKLKYLRFFERILTWLPLGAQYYLLAIK